MAKFKVGDKVRVKSKDEVSKHQIVFRSMKEYCGKSGFVRSMGRYEAGECNYYCVAFPDGDTWTYDEESLEGVEEESKDTLSETLDRLQETAKQIEKRLGLVNEKEKLLKRLIEIEEELKE